MSMISVGDLELDCFMPHASPKLREECKRYGYSLDQALDRYAEEIERVREYAPKIEVSYGAELDQVLRLRDDADVWVGDENRRLRGRMKTFVEHERELGINQDDKNAETDHDNPHT